MRYVFAFLFLATALGADVAPVDSSTAPTSPSNAQYSEAGPPQPAAAVQKALDQSEQQLQTRDGQAALASAGKALELAVDAGDVDGEPLAHMARAEAYGVVSAKPEQISEYL